ncbi:MAG: SIR2 family protein [Bryobacterales bacterium]|nr:SIR2 family protein [Bryobacterales bacterium]
MRFCSTGPSIPDSLLRERDAGRVVFLCGAGVSVPAKMPTFVKLTKLVIEDLAPVEDSDVLQVFEPWVNAKTNIPVTARTSLDQIFNMLQQEFGRDQVGKLVTKHLGIGDPAMVDTSKHSIIARISSSRDGVSQIVTTNFDHLFEHACEGASTGYYEPPSFPDLRHGVPLTGITYLHGRLAEESSAIHDYVLSSSDFGRAYLAEGWATSFIRSLLEKYTVILLGYQAEDPPVKYLLQGLSSVRGQNRHMLYAFDRGQPDVVGSKWQDRGVVPIAYGNDHELLWDSLEAWAERSDDPGKWTSSILAMAQEEPSALKAHQRGMVCHVIQTSSGAKLFAEADPIPPAEWLCVFDKNCRSAKRISSHRPGEGVFAATEAFGLDDDPSFEGQGVSKIAQTGEDFISWRRGDDSPDSIHRLSRAFPEGHEPIPARLFHLARWMTKIVDQPTLAWWAARQPGLHPRLLVSLKLATEEAKDLPQDARTLWHIILEALTAPYDTHSQSWFHLQTRIKRNGWSSSVLRAFQEATEPIFKIKSPGGTAEAKPPPKAWSDTAWPQIAEIDIEFPDMPRDELEIPDEIVPEVFSIIQRNLVRTVERLHECQKPWFHVKSLYRENTNGDGYIAKSDAFVFYFKFLLDRLSEINPNLLKGQIATWSRPEEIVFDKLRLYVLNKPELYNSQTVAEHIISCDDISLWNPKHKQELLYLLRDRWSGFNDNERRRIAARVLNGRPRYPNEDDEQFELHRNEEAAVRFGWLVQAGCEMPAPSLKRWGKIKRQIPNWNDAWTESAAQTPEGRSGWIRTNEDASVLEGVPVSKILAIAAENAGRSMMEFIERRPFVGLVKEQPTKAIAALSVAATRGEYPVEFWNEIISHWPLTPSHHANRDFCEAIRKLPQDVVLKLRSEITTWLEKNLEGIAEIDETYAFNLFDDLLSGLLSGEESATESALSAVHSAGVEVGRSRSTITHAINGPIGKATTAMLSLLSRRTPAPAQGMPVEFSTRFERLLGATGEGKEHAACLLAERVDWLTLVAPDWTKNKMNSWFELDHPRCEAAWNGILWNGKIPSASVFDEIKEAFLEIFPKIYSWNWNDTAEENAHGWVVCASVFSSGKFTGISFEQARQCIRRMTQKGHQEVIRFLARVGQDNEDGWRMYVIPFIDHAWPKETRFQTENTTHAWISALEDSSENFPDVLDAVKPYLRPMTSVHYGLFGLTSEAEDKESLTSKFPYQTLDLLDTVISNNPGNAPYDLDRALQSLAEARPEIVSNHKYARLQELSALR